jgi:hypothetical protein
MNGASVRATRGVAAAPATVFGFLADLENHWALTAVLARLQSVIEVTGFR